MVPYIHRVEIRNYKSIGQASVPLNPFCILVGPNGAGKSNFVDALAFVSDCLSESIELAFKNRGGIGAVRRRSAGHPTHIGLRFLMSLSDTLSADYAFEIAARQTERFAIAKERCVVRSIFEEEHMFEVRRGQFVSEIKGIRPKLSPDRLALFAASATEEFRPVYDFITSMRFYSLVPMRLRELQEPDLGDYLKSDGSNAAAVLKRLQDNDNGLQKYERLCRLLSKVVEGILKVEYQAIGQRESLQFKQDVGLRYPWTFEALNMSDGTLRVLGLLLAVYQVGNPKVVAIEEPEISVHPAVTEILIQVLLDAANERQILITTQSPDILEYKELEDDQIRVVTREHNATVISPLAETTRNTIRQRLYTPGELLRSGELMPDLQAAKQAARQLNLFGRPFHNEREVRDDTHRTVG